MDMVMKMRTAYENVFEKYFRSHYLVPLYMRTAQGWQTLSELQLQPWEIENGVSREQTLMTMISNKDLLI